MARAPAEPLGDRNWDCRNCWLCDASFTLGALFGLGYDEEAEAFLGWTLRATRLTWPEPQVVYDVFGDARIPPVGAGPLEGSVGSKLVRRGNDAHAQLHLDVYGEVIDAVARFAGARPRLDRDTSQMLDGPGRTVCRRWREPDEGIWDRWCEGSCHRPQGSGFFACSRTRRLVLERQALPHVQVEVPYGLTWP